MEFVAAGKSSRTHKQIFNDFKRDYLTVAFEQVKLDNDFDASSSSSPPLIDVVIEHERQRQEKLSELAKGGKLVQQPDGLTIVA